VLWAAAGCHLFEPRASEAPAPSADPVPEPAPVVLPRLEDAGTETPAVARSEEPEPGVVQGGGPTRGTLPKAAVEKEMQRALPAFRDCYERALAQKPDLRGKLFLHFVVAPDGSVPYAAPYDEATNLDDEAVIECVLAELSKLVFPPPSGGRALVNYPLEFAPPNAR